MNEEEVGEEGRSNSSPKVVKANVDEPLKLEDDLAKQPRHSSGSNSSIANKIAAFASGVAPVRKGISNASEDSITVEEVLHKLESASRASGGGVSELTLPLPLVRSSYEHLVTARDDALRLAKELAELKSSRVQLIPPSAWVKREHKYKMDLEKYEHTIGMQQQRIERLELELQLLREGSNVKPLEQKIQELEDQLLAASEEKTRVQSKYHELSIKHRQLIETSPQVATIWNEVLVQQAAGDAAAMQRLCNFDLRHTGAHSGLSMTMSSNAAAAAAAGSGGGRNGEVSPRKLYGVSAAAAIFSQQGGLPLGPFPASGLHGDAKASLQLLEAGSIEQGPETPVLSDAASPMSAASRTAAAAAAAPGEQQQPVTAEDRAQALMAAVALEGLSPEASIAALQQLNYDLTMQLGLYQQMVARLKDAMEQSDLEKAELEADKVALEAQLTAGGEHLATAASGSAHVAGSSGRTSGRWGLGFWRRDTGTGAGGADGEGEGSIADASSIGLASLSSSRQSSMDLDAPAGQAGGSPVFASRRAGGHSPPTADAEGSTEQQQAGGSSRSGTPLAADGSNAVADSSATPTSAGAVATMPARSSSANSVGGLFGARRARAAARAASAAENMAKELKELRRQVTSVQEENKFLVQNLVEIKMELAETQSNHDQAKRALVRAMDKEACLDMRVSELTHMLDLATQQQANGLAGIAAQVAESAGAAASAAIAAAGAAAEAHKQNRRARAAHRASREGSGSADLSGSGSLERSESGSMSVGSVELSASEGVDEDVDAAAAPVRAAAPVHAAASACGVKAHSISATSSEGGSSAGGAGDAAAKQEGVQQQQQQQPEQLATVAEGTAGQGSHSA